MRKLAFYIFVLGILSPPIANCQTDSIKLPWYNFHFQQTIITQYHPTFNAKYTGFSSLKPDEETQTSLTSTLFFGLRLWKNASIYVNPELAGGSGFSQARGVAGFPNGETFRIGSPAPAIYLARGYFQQVFGLSKNYSMVDDDLNQMKQKVFDKQLRFVIGKYSMADFFDCNSYSHDPRSQFMNWSLMSTGAWDYPANTRGYTVGSVIEYTSKKFEARIGICLVPTYANGPILDYNINKANSNTAEIQYNYSIRGRKGNVKLLGFFTSAPMGTYTLAVLNPDTTDISLSRKYGHTKYGGGINFEQELNSWIGVFGRASWNDGRNETWAFTEIDQSAQLGIVLNGQKWNRKDDNLGIAAVTNGISIYHQAYLKKGGYGFIIGDGNLNYTPEFISEVYYNFTVPKLFLSISPGYQFIANPAYNKDRGPVHVLSLRMHTQF